MIKPNVTLSVIFLGIVFMFAACDDAPVAKKQSSPNVISKKIFQPVSRTKKQIKKENEKEKNTPLKTASIKSETDTAKMINKPLIEESKKEEHYDFKGKIDPFKPLIQEKSDQPVHANNRPKRILTPLEKIDLSQIKLVAVIILQNRQIAMVEDVNGKGYEIGIGTYMGKNQGQVSEIKDKSIMVKEIVKDFRGRLKEKIQEIKLQKSDSEE